jgi:UDP-glucose 4-epimerase
VKALVTGGAGFIGSNLVRELAATGHEVVVLDNLLSGHSSNLNGLAVQFVEGDIRDDATLGRAIRGAQVVYHLAASVGNKRSIDAPLVDADINVIGTLRVLEACRQFEVEKIVMSSSAGIFGELKTLPIREDHPTEPDTPYGSTKLCAEKLCLSYTKLYDLQAVCLRYFNVYGPHQRFDAYGNVIPIFVFRMLDGEAITVFGDGDQTRDFINVRDVVQANMKAAAAKGVSGAFNIGSGTRITINALVSELGRAWGRQPTVSHGPERPGDVRHSLADITAARLAFGFAPAVDLSAGLQEYVEWAQTAVAHMR